jgi:hypothetical protein
MEELDDKKNYFADFDVTGDSVCDVPFYRSNK